MQMIPSAEAIGQGDCEASKTTGARTFVTRVAFTHAATTWVAIEPSAAVGLSRRHLGGACVANGRLQLP